MLAKDCMESSKGAAGFRIKNGMANRDFHSGTRKRKASHQTGSDWVVGHKITSLWDSVAAGLRVCVQKP
jgi:hypothetical protein